MMNLFVTEDDGYVRDLNPLLNYLNLTSLYVSRCTGRDYDEVREWLRNKMKTNHPKVYPTPPQIKYLSRDNSLDREVCYTSLPDYIAYINKHKRIMAPTGTTYKPPKEELSLFTPYVNKGRSDRAVYKGKMQSAKLAGDSDNAGFYNELQNNAKIDNNSLSGSEQSPSTIIHQQSAHPSLTSTGRVSTSIANALNEKLLANNRHYDNYNTIRDNLVVMTYTTKHEAIAKLIERYNLHVPTTDDILDVIHSSSRYYGISRNKLTILTPFITKMSPEEKCNFVYNGSFWGIITYCPDVARLLISSMIEPADITLPLEEAEVVMKNSYGPLIILATYLCDHYTKGLSLSKCKQEKPEVYGLVANTIVKLNKVLEEHSLLWETFFKLDTLPVNIYNIQSIYRKCAVTSDTDSTNYTTQEISKFYTGKYAHTDTDRRINFMMTYLSSMLIIQTLGIMSCNIGVPPEQIREIEMKNEFYTPIHCLTPSAKNYIMLQGGQEGNMLPKLDLVTKGVELRSSKIPKDLLDMFEEYKKDIFLRVVNGEQLKMKDILTLPVTIEHMVRTSLQKGETKYMFHEYIKTPDAYSDEEDARQWQYHTFYMEVLSSKYGVPDYVPYTSYVANTTLSTKSKLAQWVNSLPEGDIKNNLNEYLTKYGKTKINMVSLPQNIFTGKRVPEEIMTILDVDMMTVRIMSNWYLLLESFGIYLKNKYNTKMMCSVFSDYIDPDSLGRYNIAVIE